MLNIKKVRYIRSAHGGTSLSPLLPPKDKWLEPYNWEEEMKGFIPMNPYMTSNGIAKPQSLMPLLQSKPVGSIAKSTDVATLNNNLQKIVANRDLSPKLGFFLNPTNMGYLNLGIGLANNMLFSGEENSSLTNGINLGWDTAANAIGGIDPVLGTVMKGITFAGNSLKSIGGGTDQMTTTDLILDSAPMTFLTMGLNGFLGSKTQNFSANKLTIELVGGSYGGSVKNINDAASKARKKYGIASSGSKKIVNNQIDAARGWQNTMTDIATEATDLSAIATDMSQLNHLNYNFNLNGGYDLRYMRAKDGGKLARIKKLSLSKFKTGGTISGSVNLETKEIEWTPIITEPIEVYEDGGKVWIPDISEPIELFEEGGKTEKVDGITGAAPKITFLSWYDTVPKDRLSNNYDLKKAFEVLPFEELEAWRKSSDEDLRIGKNHLRSIYQLPNGDYEFLKLGNELSNPEVHFETDTYHSGENGLKDSNDLVFEKDRYFYRRKPKQFKNGGKPEPIDAPEIEETNLKNIIPEGALHARKHNMENADNLTKKGIPVIDNDREQLAEIELNEIIFTLEVTKKLEELQKDGSDEAAIEAGKLLVEQILFNTDDRTGLISTLKLGGIVQPKNE